MLIETALGFDLPNYRNRTESMNEIRFKSPITHHKHCFLEVVNDLHPKSGNCAVRLCDTLLLSVVMGPPALLPADKYGITTVLGRILVVLQLWQ